MEESNGNVLIGVCLDESGSKSSMSSDELAEKTREEHARRVSESSK